METMTFNYKTSRKLEGKAHVGVAGSGDLELLMEPSADGQAHVEIRTTAKGFGDIWRAGLDRFFKSTTWRYRSKSMILAQRRVL